MNIVIIVVRKMTLFFMFDFSLINVIDNALSLMCMDEDLVHLPSQKLIKAH